MARLRKRALKELKKLTGLQKKELFRQAKGLAAATSPKREPIRIKGQHSVVEEVRRKRHPLKGRIRRALKRGVKPEPEYNLSHALAHAFFPRNFAKVVAASTDMRKTYFERAKISPESQKAIEGFYATGGLGSPEFRTHEARVRRELRAGKFTKAGLMVNDHPVNVGFRNREPVFFEVWAVNIKKAEKHAQGIGDAGKRRAALEIISELKRHIPAKRWNIFANVHPY